MSKIFSLLLIGSILFLAGSVSTASAKGSHPYGIEKQDCSQVIHMDIIHVGELQLEIPEAAPDVTIYVAEAGSAPIAPEQSINDPPDSKAKKTTAFNLRC